MCEVVMSSFMKRAQKTCSKKNKLPDFRVPTHEHKTQMFDLFAQIVMEQEDKGKMEHVTYC